MTENYFYPDADETMEIYDTLEDLLARGKITRALGDVSKVYADPSPDYLLQILFTPVDVRCHYLFLWGQRSYQHILSNIKNGTYQDLSEEEFEEKRKNWIEAIRNTDHPTHRVAKVLKYAREVDAWETKNHFLWLVAHNKAQLIYIEVCSNMIEKGYSLSAIAEIVPKVSKADIYGLSHMLKMPIELTAEEREAVEKEYRKTGRPDVLKDIFGEQEDMEGKSGDE